MRLFPTEPSFDLYEDGFEGNDILGRAATGKKLSELLERIEDPLVVALDGKWGTGKTYFLKRWVGAHVKENGGAAKTVYFDAFAHDFLDDPLTDISAAILDQLPNETSPKIDRFKKAVARFAKPLLRISMAAATAGVSEVGGAMVDAAAAGVHVATDEAAEAFWAREKGKREAMEQVKAALRALTTPSTSDDGAVPRLIIVIDELDRCRPDYALSVLETIKHFFAVDNVHFVLGVNLGVLQYSVKARYGVEIDAEAYLRRFIAITLELPDQIADAQKTPAIKQYFNETAQQMKLPVDMIQGLGRLLEVPNIRELTSIRDVNRLLSQAALTKKQDFNVLYSHVNHALILMRAIGPALYTKLKANQASIADIEEFFGSNVVLNAEYSYPPNYVRVVEVQLQFWRYLFGLGTESERQKISQSIYNISREPTVKDVVATLVEEYLETFTLSS
jgi:hypothetical protein